MTHSDGIEGQAVREGGAVSGGHTPGPLVVGYYDPSPAFLRIKEHVAVMRPDGSLVALFGPVGGLDANHADAALFAAAPDLLAACEAMNEWDAMEKGAPPYDSDGGAHFRARIAACDRAFDLARAAIEKARGQTHDTTPTPSAVPEASHE